MLIMFFYYNDTVQRHEQRCCWNGAIDKKVLLLLCRYLVCLFMRDVTGHQNWQYALLLHIESQSEMGYRLSHFDGRSLH